MSEINNVDSLNSSSDNVFNDESKNLSRISDTSVPGKRHRIILSSSPEGPPLPKFPKLSDTLQTDNDKNEETPSEDLNLPDQRTSPIIAKLLPLTSNVINGIDKDLNNQSCSFQKSTNSSMEIDNENPNDPKDANESIAPKDSCLVTDEVTIEIDSDNEEAINNEETTKNLEKEEHNSTIVEIHHQNGENKQCTAIIKSPCKTQVATLTGPTRLDFLLNEKLARVNSQINPGVINDHVYVEQTIPNQPSTSDHMYQIANISDDSEPNELQGSRYSFSDLNLAQMVLNLKQDVQELSSKVERQTNILNAVVSFNQFNLRPLFAQSFPDKYGFQVPFTKLQDFLQFNEDLSKNVDVCNEFIASLCAYLDNNVTLSKNILNMIRVYMSRELTMLFTAIKPTGHKLVLKDTLFCKCLMQAAKLSLRHGLLPLEFEKAFLKHLGMVIGGAKSWPDEHNSSRENSQEQF